MGMDISTQCINTIRTLSMDAVEKANSGHPGTPMALAPLGFTLFDRFMQFNPGNPGWMNRDRFVLSAGHASMLLYSLLHITGYDLSLDDIRQFRQLHSRTPGHPENFLTPGVEVTTGPLGQGAAASVGMAIAREWSGIRYNRPGFPLIDYSIFVIVSDGDLMEGISSEAASLAGHLGLGHLIWFYDNNRITIEGDTKLAFSEDVAKRFQSYHWHVQRVHDVNDISKLAEATAEALREEGKPSLVIVDSYIAYGSPGKQGTAEAHGAPLGVEEVRRAKEFFQWPTDRDFYVPDEVMQYRNNSIERGKELEENWNQLLEGYREAYPQEGEEFDLILSGELPRGWSEGISSFESSEKGLSGREVNGKLLNAAAGKIPWILGGSADLAPSTKTLLKGEKSFSRSDFSGRNIHFGVREHAMGGICNGLALSLLRPFCSTFLIFSDYLRPSLRLASLMKIPVIHVYSHDSIGLGEDGPTHQPIEHLSSLRAIPNLEVIRPADANELAVLWKEHILFRKDGPLALIVSRQNLPVIDRTKYSSAAGASRGGYVLADCEGVAEVILISTGSEVHICLKAYETLMQEGVRVRVVSMPCIELFEMQDETYRELVLPAEVTARVAVEAGSSLSWWRYVDYQRGRFVGLSTFGASAPYKELYEEFGITPERTIEAVRDCLGLVR